MTARGLCAKGRIRTDANTSFPQFAYSPFSFFRRFDPRGCTVKRFIGWMLVLAGGAAAVWGGTCVLTGTSRARMDFGNDFSISAMTGGLAGLAVLTIGLIWVRD